MSDIYTHTLHIKENLRYQVVIRFLLQNIFLPLTNPLDSHFSLFWISNPLCPSIQGDNFDTVLAPVIGRAKEEVLTSSADNLENYTDFLLFTF